MLPVAVVNGSLPSRLRASARPCLQWLRPRAAPCAVAAAWLCAIVAGARCTSGTQRADVRVAAAPLSPPLPARVRPPVRTPAPAVVVDPPSAVPDPCEPDGVLGVAPAHRRVSREPCIYSVPSCGYHGTLAARRAYEDRLAESARLARITRSGSGASRRRAARRRCRASRASRSRRARCRGCRRCRVRHRRSRRPCRSTPRRCRRS